MLKSPKGVFLMGQGESDPEFRARTLAFRQELERLGWAESRNLQFKIWAASGGEIQALRRHIKEMIAFAPDVIVAGAGSPGILALQQATQTIPVIFVNVTDPVGVGVITSLSRPTGNMTGFTPFEYGISVKWLELLK
jgi:putative ABC transport system substrate-binding protein